jgi:transposase InsO family protein
MPSCNGPTITTSLGTTTRGKPVQNAFAESFIGRLRDELLNETAFGDTGTRWLCIPYGRFPIERGLALGAVAAALDHHQSGAVA